MPTIMDTINRKCRRLVKLLLHPVHNARMYYLKKKGMAIGDNVHIMQGTILDVSRPFLIEIGSNVTIAPRCHILTHDASMNIFLKATRIGRVKINDNCFIGAGTIVLPNVTIGPDVVIGAGSVVTASVEPSSVYVGNPARKICSIDDFLAKHRRLINEKNNYPYPEFHGYWITEDNAEKMKEELENDFGYSTKQ